MLKGLHPPRDVVTLLELVATFVTGLSMWELFLRLCVLMMSYYVLVTCKNIVLGLIKQVLIMIGKFLLRMIQSLFYRCCRVFQHNCTFCNMPVQKNSGHCMTCCHVTVHVSCMEQHVARERLHCANCKSLTDRLLLQQVFSHVFQKAYQYKIFDLAPLALSASILPVRPVDKQAEHNISDDFVSALKNKQK